jgi:hypothetical protein
VEFDDLLRIGTPPSIFKAYFDAFCKGMATEVQRVFNETLQIGLANTSALRLQPVEWARTHLTIMIESKSRLVASWIKSVCDKQDESKPIDTDEDFKEYIFWKTWRAPKFIHMKPSGNTGYDHALAWTREDEATTEKLLKGFTNKFIHFLEFDLDKFAGDAHINLAMIGEAQEPGKQPLPAEQLTQQERGIEMGADRSVKYPQEFPPRALALIEAEKLRARRQLQEQVSQAPWSKYGPSATDEENFRKYVLRVFLVFAKEACKLGAHGSWTMDRVRAETDEFLRLFTIQAYYEDGHDKQGRELPKMISHMDGSILPEVRRKFRSSAEWQQFEGELLAVAEQIAKEDGLSETKPAEQKGLDANLEISTIEMENGSPAGRRAAIETFISKLTNVGRKITRKDIWTVAGYQDPTEFERFQRSDHRTTASAATAFTRILAMKPEDFIQLLKKKIPQG